jgi:hypothetical protein
MLTKTFLLGHMESPESTWIPVVAKESRFRLRLVK